MQAVAQIQRAPSGNVMPQLHAVTLGELRCQMQAAGKPISCAWHQALGTTRLSGVYSMRPDRSSPPVG